jgi:hypothetical protein
LQHGYCNDEKSNRGGIVMRDIRHMAGAALMLVLGAPGIAFAGAVPIHVPEPSTLAVLAVGIGAAALVKFRKRK